MCITEAISFFIIMVTLALVPSSSVALVITRSVTHGVPDGIAVTLGIVTGDIIFVAMAILGLSMIAETMSWLFLSVKYIGAIYLIWLGYSLLTSTTKTEVTIEKANQNGNMAASFLAGLVLTLGDIKAIFFYVSLFPAFINIELLRLADIVIIMVVTIVTVGGVKIFYAFSANKVANMTKGYNLESKAQKAAGSFMIGAGSYLIVKT